VVGTRRAVAVVGARRARRRVAGTVGAERRRVTAGAIRAGVSPPPETPSVALGRPAAAVPVRSTVRRSVRSIVGPASATLSRTAPRSGLPRPA
jgi:hypothetical protein